MSAVLAVAAGCSNVPPKPVAPPPPVAPPVVPDPSFDVPERVLDVFNATGRVLVRAMGAMYDSRSQMLGIYEVHYSGDHFLIRCQGLPLEPGRTTVLTHVDAMHLDSSPDRSPAAVAMLGILQQQLQQEVADERQRQIDQQRELDAKRDALKQHRKTRRHHKGH